MAQASLWSVSFYVDGLKKKISSVCAILVVQSKLSKSNVDSMNITLVMPHRVTNTRAGRNHKVHVPISYSYMCKELPGRLVKEITEYHVASWCQGWTGSHLSGKVPFLYWGVHKYNFSVGYQWHKPTVVCFHGTWEKEKYGSNSSALSRAPSLTPQFWEECMGLEAECIMEILVQNQLPQKLVA